MPGVAEASRPRPLRNSLLCLAAAVLWFLTVRYVWGWDAYISPIVKPAFGWLMPSGVSDVTAATVERSLVNALPAFALAVPLMLLIASPNPLRWVLAFGTALTLYVMSTVADVPPMLVYGPFVLVYLAPFAGAAAGAAAVAVWKRREHLRAGR